MSKIVVRYESGRHEIFDTLNYTATEPFKPKGTNVMTDIVLGFDDLETDGLLMELYWYDAGKGDSAKHQVKETGVSLPHALRQIGNAILLVAPSELDSLSSITLDDELVVWRQGGQLINGVKFNAQQILCFSNDTTASLNARAVAVFSYLQTANPNKSDEEICNMMGFTLEAYRNVEAAEYKDETEDTEDEPLADGGVLEED